LANLKSKKKSDKTSPGQKSLWDEWNEPIEEIREVAEKFILANCFDPKIASQQFNKTTDKEPEEKV
jgi:putative transposase